MGRARAKKRKGKGSAIESQSPPQISKSVRSGLEPSIQNNPTWKFVEADVGGPWSCSDLPSKSVKCIAIRMSEYESFTWTDLSQNKRAHLIRVSEITKVARDRLINDLKRDDIDELMSMRITKKSRLWGVMRGGVYYVLWWDPDHKIYRTKSGK